jgi:glycosyltransferase involved in cell wall biosynthesis
MLRILFTGPLWEGSTANFRFQALVELGNDVHVLDYSPFCQQGARLLRAFERRFYIGPGIIRYNSLLKKSAQDLEPNLIWVDKGIYIWPSTLGKIKARTGATIIHYTPDDYFGKDLYYDLVLKSINIYDAFFTTKTFNVPELLRLGAKKVQYSANAFDPRIHRPIELSPEEKRIYSADVGFIGRWEPDREETFAKLAEKGIDMKIWGEGWSRGKIARSLRRFVQNRGVYGLEYPKAIAGCKINLNILSKWYRDEETTRSIEIPACGGFMLAERTSRHLEYFREGKEAEFFSCFDELLAKIQFYLSNDERRKQIACAGRRRCLENDYSYKNRIQSVLSYLRSEGLIP